jgi:hypothetical protein
MKFLNELLSAPLHVKIAALIVLSALVACVYFVPIAMLIFGIGLGIIASAIVVLDWFL